jgi:hypothetical protein
VRYFANSVILKEKARLPMGYLASEEGDEKKLNILFQNHIRTFRISVLFDIDFSALPSSFPYSLY